MRWRHLRAAFNARPLGMLIPPNWLALAAFGLLGWAVNPGLWLIGAGLEVAYLAALAGNRRFRAAVDAAGKRESPWDVRYRDLFGRLGADDQRRQQRLEARCREIVETLQKAAPGTGHGEDLARLCWLHLRLLVARAAIGNVVRTATEAASELATRRARLVERVRSGEAGGDLERSLRQQLAVVEARQLAHDDAARRFEHVDAELERIDQQVALLREQALLATDEDQVARSVDAISASLGEANRWLHEQQELLGALDELSAGSPPADILIRGTGSAAGRKLEESS